MARVFIVSPLKPRLKQNDVRQGLHHSIDSAQQPNRKSRQKQQNQSNAPAPAFRQRAAA